jgi:hypothetical protein
MTWLDNDLTWQWLLINWHSLFVDRQCLYVYGKCIYMLASMLKLDNNIYWHANINKKCHHLQLMLKFLFLMGRCVVHSYSERMDLDMSKNTWMENIISDSHSLWYCKPKHMQNIQSTYFYNNHSTILTYQPGSTKMVEPVLVLPRPVCALAPPVCILVLPIWI